MSAASRCIRKRWKRCSTPILGSACPWSAARRNPITGAVVVADVVLANPASTAAADAPDVVRADLLAACRRVLAAHKVPATLHFVPALEFTAAGKLVRPNQ